MPGMLNVKVPLIGVAAFVVVNVIRWISLLNWLGARWLSTLAVMSGVLATLMNVPALVAGVEVAVVFCKSGTGRLASAPLKTTVNGPPSRPTTKKLFARAGSAPKAEDV